VPADFPFRECNINEHLFLIRVKESYNPWYVLGFLLSDLGQTLIKREITGGAQRGITKDSVENIIVPIPPKDIQNEVERRVKEALEGIKRKKQEIIEIFEEYKKWVSTCILS
jgi:type I restriction enzyme S subunit